MCYVLVTELERELSTNRLRIVLGKCHGEGIVGKTVTELGKRNSRNVFEIKCNGNVFCDVQVTELERELARVGLELFLKMSWGIYCWKNSNRIVGICPEFKCTVKCICDALVTELKNEFSTNRLRIVLVKMSWGMYC